MRSAASWPSPSPTSSPLTTPRGLNPGEGLIDYVKDDDGGTASPASRDKQQASPLAARPYDLRHACVSLWLNSGVDPVEVARRTGHSAAVPPNVYAKCLDGATSMANDRIDKAMATWE